MKIVSVIGARPQFIKAAPVSKEIRQTHREILLHTGQHYDRMMSEIFFRELGIPEPDYNLGIGSGHHGWQTGKMLSSIEEVLLQEKPDRVLVYGDTNSTLAGALAAVKLHIPVAHVEAGLRSFNREMPEEINRILTDHLSDLLLCATETAVHNLAAEGIQTGVHNVGDVMYDAVLYNIKIAWRSSRIMERLRLQPGAYLLTTVHRPRNTDRVENLRAILSAFESAGEPVIFPAHPRTQAALKKADLSVDSNVRIIEPVSYLDMLVLEQNARLILTDSGGMQKEAYFLGVPCITLRLETEWVETVEAGWNVIVGSDMERIVASIRGFQPKGSRCPEIFGDGRAAEKIYRLLG